MLYIVIITAYKNRYYFENKVYQNKIFYSIQRNDVYMKEDFLHYIWQNGFFKHQELTTVQREPLRIINRGRHNTNAGPDFLNARILIDTIHWAGHVEIHKYSSDWYAHGHEKDPAYDNVILHVVYEDNMPVYNSNNVQIPTLELSKFVLKGVLKRYNKLIKNKSILRCQNDIQQIDKFAIINYKYRLFIERLEMKHKIIDQLLTDTNNNWDQVFYQTLLKYIGGHVNKEAFELLGRLLPYKIFYKYKDNLLKMEALLFGTAGFLEEKRDDVYYQLLQLEYRFLKNKHQLKQLPPNTVRFHRMRPSNFPTIRLAQLAQLYFQNNHLFEKLVGIKQPQDAYNILNTTASAYWDTHYNFEKSTKYQKKYIGRDFMDVILINVIIPLKFAYQKYRGEYNANLIISLIESIKAEKNRIVSIFNKINLKSRNALDTQAILQLNENYCSQNKCLSCDIGHYILKQGIQ